MAWRPDSPWNELQPLPPSTEVETRAVLKATTAARSELARLDEAARSLPNATILINSLPLLEAQASSEIENIVTTTDELFKYAEDAAAADPATREALRYRTALREGFDAVRARPLSANLAQDLCSIIKGYRMTIRSGSGTYIRSRDGGPLYTPPEGSPLIAHKLAQWEQYLHERSSYDPLVTMALAHYQFEAIHPFEDGNGRTGRILNVLLLVERGLLQLPILYLSRYIIETKSEYYDLLLRITRDGAWESWVLYILEGVRRTAIFTLAKIAGVRALQVEVHDDLARVLGAVDADLLAVLFEQPYVRIGLVMERCGISRPTATKRLKALADADVLRRVQVGAQLVFVNHRLLELLRRPEDVPTRDDGGASALF